MKSLLGASPSVGMASGSASGCDAAWSLWPVFPGSAAGLQAVACLGLPSLKQAEALGVRKPSYLPATQMLFTPACQQNRTRCLCKAPGVGGTPSEGSSPPTAGRSTPCAERGRPQGGTRVLSRQLTRGTECAHKRPVRLKQTRCQHYKKGSKITGEKRRGCGD